MARWHPERYAFESIVTSSPQRRSVSDGLLTAGEVAELLNVPVSWVHESTRSGAIPVVELGRHQRYRRLMCWHGSATRSERKRSPSSSWLRASIAGTMRPTLMSFGLLVALAGCGSSETGIYDNQAKDEAQREAAKDPFGGDGEDVSVGSARERSDCPQAPSKDAGPCLAVEMTAVVPTRETSGELDPAGRKVEAVFEVFVWLERNTAGRWVVTHRTLRPKGASVSG
jgi:excisionase family DNA binding protein